MGFLLLPKGSFDFLPSPVGLAGSCLMAGKSFLKSNPHPAAASTRLSLHFLSRRARAAPTATHHPAGGLSWDPTPTSAPAVLSLRDEGARNWFGL